MCYAVKTSEANAIIQAFVEIGKSLNETLDYFFNKYPNDKDITKEYVEEEYNSFSKEIIQ